MKNVVTNPIKSGSINKWRRWVVCISNREDREDREEKMSAHLAAEQLDCAMDRKEIARPVVDSVENKTVEGIHPVHRAWPYLSQAERTFHRLPH